MFENSFMRARAKLLKKGQIKNKNIKKMSKSR